MTKLLTRVLSKVQKLPVNEQDGAAELLQDYIANVKQDVRLTDKQLAEVNRRLAERNPKTLTLAQFDAHLKKRGML